MIRKLFELYIRSFDIRWWRMWLAVSLSFVMAACSEEENTKTVETLRVATPPYQQGKEIQNSFQELLDIIAKQTGLKIERVIPETFEESLYLFNTKQVDMALLGGVLYVKAHMQSNAIPLVTHEIRDYFRSVAIVHANNPATTLQDMKGSSLAFGDPFSASGHFMPRYFLQEKNIIPETFFKSVIYTGDHEVTANLVRNGKVDLGLVNSDVLNRMITEGQIKMEEIKVIWLSPLFHDYVWAIQSHINQRTRTLIRDSFLNLSHDANNKELLFNLGVSYYIPATHDDYREMEQIVREMEQRKTLP